MTEQERLICEVSHGNFAAARNRAIAELSDTFTTKDFRRVLRLQGRRAYFALKLLLDQGIIEKVGTRDRAFLYKMSQNVN